MQAPVFTFYGDGSFTKANRVDGHKAGFGFVGLVDDGRGRGEDSLTPFVKMGGPVSEGPDESVGLVPVLSLSNVAAELMVALQILFFIEKCLIQRVHDEVRPVKEIIIRLDNKTALDAVQGIGVPKVNKDLFKAVKEGYKRVKMNWKIDILCKHVKAHTGGGLQDGWNSEVDMLAKRGADSPVIFEELVFDDNFLLGCIAPKPGERSPSTRARRVPFKLRADAEIWRGPLHAPAAIVLERRLIAPTNSDEAIKPDRVDELLNFELLPYAVRLPAVRWIHSGAVVLFAEVTAKLLCTLNALVESEAAAVLIDLVSEAFLFFPAVLTRKGKTVSVKTMVAILEELLIAEDLVLNLLTRRNNFIERESGMKKGRGRASSGGVTKRKFSAKDKGNVEELIHQGNLGKAMNRLEQKAVYSPAVNANGELIGEARTLVQKLFPRNPEGELETLLGQEEVESVFEPATGEDVLEVQARLKRLSSSGLCAWSYELLRLLLSGLQVASLVDLFTVFFNNINSGKVGSSRIWINSMLGFIAKSEGGLRGICVDNVFIRMAGKVALAVDNSGIGQILVTGGQLGVGVKGGSQVLAHTIANWVSLIKAEVSSKKIVVKLDIVKAFNSVFRSSIRDAVLEFKPSLVKSFDWEYGSPTSLFLPDGTCAGTCERGIRTGDTRGPAYFSLALHPVLLEVKRRHPDVDVLGVLDDITLHGDVEEVLPAIDSVKELLAGIGCVLHPDDQGKNKIFCVNPTLPINSNIGVVRNGFEVVGVPIGSQEFINDVMSDKLVDLNKSLQLLTLIDPIYALPLLKFCIHTRMSYLARALKPWNSRDSFEVYDLLILKIVKDLFGLGSLQGVALEILKLPWKCGGMGIQSFKETASVAWTTSFCAAHNLAAVEPSLRSAWEGWFSLDVASRVLRRHLGCIKKLFPDFQLGVAVLREQLPVQGMLMRDLFHRKAKKILEVLADQGEVAMASFFSAQAGAQRLWLCAAYNKCPVSARVFFDAIKTSLLFPVFRVPGGDFEEQCPCKVLYSEASRHVVLAEPKNTYHGFHCQLLQGDIIKRHNELYKELLSVIKGFFPSAQYESEKVLYHPASPEVHHKCDVLLTLANGDVFVIDFAICVTASASRVGKSAAKALKAEEDRKRRLYDATLQRSKFIFVPFIMDVCGNFGSAAIAFLDRLQSEVASDSRFKSKVKAKLSSLLVTINSRFISLYLIIRERAAFRTPSDPGD